MHLKCVKCLQELAFKVYTSLQTLQCQESSISPMRYYDVYVMLDQSWVLKLQLIGKKTGEIKKFCVLHTVFSLLPSSLLMVTSPVPLLSENHRKDDQLSLEKKLE